jgi:hypothetical protein
MRTGGHLVSAFIAVQIACDADGCTKAHTPSWSAVSSVGEARREARRSGWTVTGPRGRARRDYCPEHKQAARHD